MQSFLKIFILCLLVNGCGWPQQSQVKFSGKPITFVLAGGYGSCRFARVTEQMDMVGQFKKLQKQVRKFSNRPIKIVRSCFVIPYSNSVRYSYGSGVANQYTKSVKDYVENVLPSYLNGDVYMIGHSHGGWVVLKSILEAMKKNRQFKLKGLFTLDPISWQKCGAAQVTYNYFKFGYTGKEYLPCTQAPADLAGGFADISYKAEYWHNFYQVYYPLLHSSAINEAHRNTMPRMKPELRIDGPHGQLIRIPSIWQSIFDRVLLSIR